MARKNRPLLPRWCEICGNSIPHNPGHPAKTCGSVCHAERIKRKGAAYYVKVKNSDEWKETRSAYLEKLKLAMQDPEFAAIRRAYQAAVVARSKTRIDADPIARAASLEKKRAVAAAWRLELQSDPDAFEKHKAKARTWYASLSPQERDRIYNIPRRLMQRARRA